MLTQSTEGRCIHDVNKYACVWTCQKVSWFTRQTCISCCSSVFPPLVLQEKLPSVLAAFSALTLLVGL